jgi:hypothetical protein
VPGRYELAAPLVEELADPLAGGGGRPAERVAVEVDGVAVLDREAVAEGRQRVLAVEPLGAGPVGQSRSSWPGITRKYRQARCESRPGT